MIDDNYWCIDGWIEKVLNKWVQISMAQYIMVELCNILRFSVFAYM